MCMSDAIAWLSIVGINENGLAGLSEEARAAISEAVLVAGGKRHLALAQDLIRGEQIAWRSPPHETIPALLAKKPQKICVLTSGDPFNYGMGAVLARHIPASEMNVFPAPSIVTKIAAKRGWAVQDMVVVALNGRPVERLIAHLQPGAKILCLSADEHTPQAVAAILNGRGFGTANMTIYEHVGGTNERAQTMPASEFNIADIARLNCIAFEVPIDAARCLPLTPGLADDWFEHDGQMTKREVRAVTLAALAPRRGELLWDIGLGAGSVAIEWLLADPMNRAIGFEQNAERAARAKRNSKALGVPQLVVLEGEAPAILEGMDAPDAVFIGGGAGEPGMVETVWNILKPGGRLVMNAVSLESEAILLAAQKQYGGALIRISVERAEAVGSMTGWKPAMTVTQWSVVK